jgi:large subunit ribosomal protein L21
VRAFAFGIVPKFNLGEAMFAVVSSGGKQYRVEPGSTVVVDRVASEPGATITFDRVLLIGDGDETTIGSPLVSGASVSGTVLREELGPKLVIFKFKQKVKYRRRTGHRQHLTLVRIDEINAEGRAKAKPRAKAERQAKAEPEAEAAPVATPKPRTSRPRTAKPKAEEPEASASAASAPDKKAAEKPKRRAPARAKKAQEPEKAEQPESGEE